MKRIYDTISVILLPVTVDVGQKYTKIDNEYTQQVVRDITIIIHYVYCSFVAYEHPVTLLYSPDNVLNMGNSNSVTTTK
jgi:hypothetical protein